MDDLASDIARRAASRLVPEFGPNLPALTERALVQESERGPQRSYDVATGIAIASLVVSAVQLGWQIYRDLKADREKEAAERDERRTRQVLVRRMRLSLAEPTGRLTSQQRDRLLEVVAEEILTSEDLPG